MFTLPILLLAWGMLVGIISSFFGIGGGIIIIPLLDTLFPELPRQVIIGSSFGIIFLNAITHVRSFMLSNKRPDRNVVLLIGTLAAVGVLVAGKITLNLSRVVLQQIFGIMIVLSILKNLFFDKTLLTSSNDKWKKLLTSPPKLKLAFTGLVGGLISGFTGLGGGIIFISLFISLFQMPLSLIPVYSQSAMIFGTLVGLLHYMVIPLENLPTYGPYFQVGQVNFALIIPLFIGSSLTSKIGVKLNNIAPDKIKKRLLLLLLTVVALKTFLF